MAFLLKFKKLFLHCLRAGNPCRNWHFSAIQKTIMKLRILFICHGNICRSPMAEFIFKDIVKNKGTSHLFEIASAATSTEEIWNGVGNPVYPPARAELAKHGISCEGKRARQIIPSDYDYYDFLICMDSMNVRNAERILGHKGNSKLRKLLEFASRTDDVADPWYTDRFDVTYNDVLEGCNAFYEYLEQNKMI